MCMTLYVFPVLSANSVKTINTVYWKLSHQSRKDPSPSLLLKLLVPFYTNGAIHEEQFLPVCAADFVKPLTGWLCCTVPLYNTRHLCSVYHILLKVCIILSLYLVKLILPVCCIWVQFLFTFMHQTLHFVYFNMMCRIKFSLALHYFVVYTCLFKASVFLSHCLVQV